MRRIAEFLKVSPGAFSEAVKGSAQQYTDTEIAEMYEKLELPRRATRGSAGYDFYAPFAFTLLPG